jgi:hypothetical protein
VYLDARARSMHQGMGGKTLIEVTKDQTGIKQALVCETLSSHYGSLQVDLAK